MIEIEPDIWDLGDIWHLRTENQKTMAKWKSRQNTENRGFHGFHGPIANYTAIGICSETITAPWHCDLIMALLHIGLVKHKVSDKEISFKVYTVYILLFILLLILSTVTIWWIGWSHDMYCDCECCVVLTRLIPSDRFRIHWPWSLNLLFLAKFEKWNKECCDIIMKRCISRSYKFTVYLECWHFVWHQACFVMSCAVLSHGLSALLALHYSHYQPDPVERY